jgi:hypothetical protein
MPTVDLHIYRFSRRAHWARCGLDGFVDDGDALSVAAGGAWQPVSTAAADRHPVALAYDGSVRLGWLRRSGELLFGKMARSRSSAVSRVQSRRRWRSARIRSGWRPAAGCGRTTAYTCRSSRRIGSVRCWRWRSTAPAGPGVWSVALWTAAAGGISIRSAGPIGVRWPAQTACRCTTARSIRVRAGWRS